MRPWKLSYYHAAFMAELDTRDCYFMRRNGNSFRRKFNRNLFSKRLGFFTESLLWLRRRQKKGRKGSLKAQHGNRIRRTIDSRRRCWTWLFMRSLMCELLCVASCVTSLLFLFVELFMGSLSRIPSSIKINIWSFQAFNWKKDSYELAAVCTKCELIFPPTLSSSNI